MNKDLLAGVGLLAVAGVYYAAIGNIADSTLEDDVGATGLPLALAALLAVVAIALIVRALIAGRAAKAAAALNAAAAPKAAAVAVPDEEEEEAAPLPRAIGLLLFGAAYVAVLPYAGYLLSIAGLITGVALYEGSAKTWKLPVIALGGAIFYWAIFVKLLAVRQPAGLFFSGYLS